MMNLIKKKLGRLFKPYPEPNPSNAEELRLNFKSRYHHFKLLLNANNRCLEEMAEMEQALKGDKTFGMSFVRTCCTAISVNVLTMINNMEHLAPGKYPDLGPRFDAIRTQLDHLLHPKARVKEERLVIPFDRINQEMANVVGSKMAKLGEIKNQLEINVPQGFVITATAYERFIHLNDLQDEIDTITQASGADDLKQLDIISAQIQQKIITASMLDGLETAVNENWDLLEQNVNRPLQLAIRSSALCEDSLESSFAGQYRSELNVDQENFAQIYKEVVASKYSVQAMTYRLNKGFRDEDIAMCIGCMEMIDAVAGGVIYTRNPVNADDDSVFINSAWGLPKLVVDGSDSFDLLAVSRKHPFTITRRDIGEKTIRYRCSHGDGIEKVPVPDANRTKPSIDDPTALELARISLAIEDYYTIPQDIEWALSQEDRLYILQCRPLQQKKRTAPAPDLPGLDKPLLSGGITASPGTATGPVYRATRDADILWFPENAILLVDQARPRWAPLLNRAAGIISEHGGFAGHLANVAREFSVPAIMNIQGAIETLEPGDVITMDADTCSVYKGEQPAILAKEQPVRPSPMKQSTVFRLLEQACDLIVPLNLIDPDATGFRPGSCKTFHDITRFIHERSVNEMFNFGATNNFPEHSSKQLHYHVPLNWWILNLDDGFTATVTGPYVRLNNIASHPMLAFWEGFILIPWDGPPPVDGRGLMSVMFRSTMNPSLVPGVRSKYADKNYFMISKHYCSLNSRLGYHFSTMEALVSGRASEDYISFQFKGGAADYDRRIKRVLFIKEILETYDFTVKVREDTLTARMEGQGTEVLKTRLMILGYLSLHTRQIDMIMSNSRRVRFYREKIGNDIDEKIIKPHFNKEEEHHG
jgi:pyruvate,water dikinase